MTVPLLLTLGLAPFFCSIVEHLVHSEYMHKRRRLFESAYESHHRKHHVERQAEESYYKDEEDLDEEEKSRMWLLVLIMIPIAAILFLRYGTEVSIASVLTALGYILAYEQLHKAMHPYWLQDHWLHRFWWFRWLGEHHRLHHKYPKKNFCVVFPFADLIFFTMCVKEIKPEPKAPPRLANLTGPLSTLSPWLRALIAKIILRLSRKKAPTKT